MLNILTNLRFVAQSDFGPHLSIYIVKSYEVLNSQFILLKAILYWDHLLFWRQVIDFTSAKSIAITETFDKMGHGFFRFLDSFFSFFKNLGQLPKKRNSVEKHYIIRHFVININYFGL